MRMVQSPRRFPRNTTRERRRRLPRTLASRQETHPPLEGGSEFANASEQISGRGAGAAQSCDPPRKLLALSVCYRYLSARRSNLSTLSQEEGGNVIAARRSGLLPKLR